MATSGTAVDWAEAGRKAWRTRQKNAQKRSNAAKKAWVTIRKRKAEVTERQVLAGFKSWETRKRNERKK